MNTQSIDARRQKERDRDDSICPSCAAIKDESTVRQQWNAKFTCKCENCDTMICHMCCTLCDDCILECGYPAMICASHTACKDHTKK